MATETAVDVVMPQMGVSVSEGTITKWLKAEGEHVEADEPLLEISTDKVDTEVPSPGTGTVTQILVQEGETVDVGTRLAVIGGAAAEAGAPEPEAPPEPATAPVVEEAAQASSVEAAPPRAEPTPAPVPAPAPQPRGRGRERQELRLARRRADRVRARRRSRERSRHGPRRPRDQEGHPCRCRIGRCAATGSRRSARPAAPAEPCSRHSHRQPVRRRPPSRQPEAAGEAGEQLEPITAMRRGIAEHMRRSLDTSAHVTSAIEVDMSKVVEIRKRLKPEYQKAYGVNITYLAFVARAVVETLRDYPWVNGELRGDQIVTRNYVNLGFAVELADGKGLIVPVLKHAEGLNLLGIARGVVDIAQRARDKKLLPDEVQGGTFTITNPGGYGTFHGTPVISQPQAAILGTYAVVKRPWVVEDEFGQDVIAIRPIMNLTLTYDHRLIDGALAGRFLRDLRHTLETWDESNY